MSSTDLAAAWPAVQPRVAAVLAARGLQGADVDDIVQEVALRALRQERTFSSDDHFVRWCCRVAINLHLDSARRQRKLAARPPEDVPSREDTARTVERRMDLAALAAGISELSADEQRLLLDPGPTEGRREAVRLAVRRHRIRARLATLIEGVVVGVPLLRKLLRSLSTPAKASVAAAVPVLVTFSLLVIPAIHGPSNDAAKETSAVPASQPPAGGTAELIGRTTQTTAAPENRSASPTQARPPSSTVPVRRSPPTTTIAAVDTPVAPVRVTHEKRPDDEPTLCSGFINACVDRPGPNIPNPGLPLL